MAKEPEKSNESPAEKPKPAGGPTAADLKTEQEKGGKDPVGKAQHSPGPVETIEDLEIGPRDPYPSKGG